MARDCWQYYNVNYIENSMLPPYSSIDVILIDYYDQHWYMDYVASSHVIGQKASLEFIHDNYFQQRISTVDGASHLIFRIEPTIVTSNIGAIKLPKVPYLPTVCTIATVTYIMMV